MLVDEITALLPLGEDNMVYYNRTSFAVLSQRATSDGASFTPSQLPSNTEQKMNDSISVNFSLVANDPINIGFSYYKTPALFPTDVQSVSSVIGATINGPSMLTLTNLSVIIQLEVDANEVCTM